MDHPSPSEGDKENDDWQSKDVDMELMVKQGKRVDKRVSPEDGDIEINAGGVRRLRDVLSLSLDERFDLKDAIENLGTVPSRAKRGTQLVELSLLVFTSHPTIFQSYIYDGTDVQAD